MKGMYVRKPKPSPKLSTTPQKKGFKAWCQHHLMAIIIVLAACIITGVFVVAMNSIDQGSDHPLNIFRKKPAEKFYSLLTGEQVADDAARKKPVTAVMIENSPEARPQSGLKHAGVVYEAPAEGGITRFMALYQGDNKPSQIGPVRSLRIYYLGWGAPYQASIAHVGGSANALQTVRSGHRDIDQFFNGNAYWRSTDRYAPHNVYTSGEKLDQLNAAKGYTESTFTSFARVDEKAAETPTASTIRLNFSSATYNTHYTYDKASNSYQRFLAGQPHRDREHGHITPKVVIALETTTERRPGPDGYDDLVTSGSGKATIFQNGTVVTATWKKEHLSAPLRLVDAEGKDIPLVRGQTWVGAFVPGRGSVSWE